MRKTTMLAGALALLAGVAVSAAAQGPGRRGHGRGFGPGGPEMAERLGLSDEQKEQMKALRERHREALKPLFEAAREAHQAYEKALDAENADPAQVGQAALAMKAARAKLEAAHEGMFEEVKAILTPEQVEKLGEGRKRGLGPGGRHGGPRRGPRGGDAPEIG